MTTRKLPADPLWRARGSHARRRRRSGPLKRWAKRARSASPRSSQLAVV